MTTETFNTCKRGHILDGSNLEIWNTNQPSGQRIEDKVEWALVLLRLYAPDKLKEGS
jgi:hypothetical protein